MAPSHPHSPTELVARKQSLRALALAARARLAPEAAAAAGDAATRHLIPVLSSSPGQTVSVFWPLPGEIDTRPLLMRLHAGGHPVLLPRVQGRGRPLALHRWQPGAALVAGRLGLQEPRAEDPTGVPDIVVTPLVAFDALGHRLGYGAGFYDRTFAMLEAMGARPLRVGFAFACQEVDAVPVDAHDRPLHLLVTEHGVQRCAAVP